MDTQDIPTKDAPPQAEKWIGTWSDGVGVGPAVAHDNPPFPLGGTGAAGIGAGPAVAQPLPTLGIGGTGAAGIGAGGAVAHPLPEPPWKPLVEDEAVEND